MDEISELWPVTVRALRTALLEDLSCVSTLASTGVYPNGVKDIQQLVDCLKPLISSCSFLVEHSECFWAKFNRVKVCTTSTTNLCMTTFEDQVIDVKSFHTFLAILLRAGQSLKHQASLFVFHVPETSFHPSLVSRTNTMTASAQTANVETNHTSPTAINLDVQTLEGLGYRQEFKRQFRLWSIFSLSFSSLGLLPSVSATLGYSLG